MPGFYLFICLSLLVDSEILKLICHSFSCILKSYCPAHSRCSVWKNVKKWKKSQCLWSSVCFGYNSIPAQKTTVDMSTASAKFLAGYYGSSRILYWLSPRVRQTALGTPPPPAPPPHTHTPSHGTPSNLSSWDHPGQEDGKILKNATCKAQGGDELINSPFLRKDTYDTYIWGFLSWLER